ncbi:MAG: COG1470 family protein [Methanobacteriota archaeon]
MRRSPLLLVLLVAPLLPVPGGDAQASAVPAWWGPSEGPDGWHLRVPVTVTNPTGSEMRDLVARVEVDLAKLLLDAGWAQRATGAGGASIESFELDEDSIRVVEYHNFEPSRPGGLVTDGTPKRLVPDDAATGDTERDYVVPSVVDFGLYSSARTDRHHPARNPLLTVEWVVPGPILPSGARSFYVYLDSKLNRDVPVYRVDSEWQPQRTLQGILDSQYWIQRGNVLFGHGASVQITGLTPETRISVFVYPPGAAGSAVLHQPPRGAAIQNPFLLGATQVLNYSLSPDRVPFAIVADRPVLATVGGHGFLPSSDRTLAGMQFSVIPPHPQLVAFAGPEGAFMFFVGDQGDVGQAVVPAGAGTAMMPQISAGVRYSIFASSPVLLTAVPTTKLVELPSLYGAPVDQVLVGLPFGTTDFVRGGRTSSSDFSNLAITDGRLFVASHAGDAAVRVSSFASPIQVFPVGSSRDAAPAPSAANGGIVAEGASRALGRPQSPAPLPRTIRDPIQVLADSTLAPGDRIAAWAGALSTPGGALASPGVPVGGLHGQRFELPYGNDPAHPWPFAAFAFYNGTTITFEGVGCGLSGRTTVPIDRLDRCDFSVTGPVSIRATKPIAVLPRIPFDSTVNHNNNHGYLPAAHDVLRATAGRLEYRGPLLDLSPPAGLSEPVVRSTGPGAATTFDLVVANRGHGFDLGNLRDSVSVTASTPPAGWRVEVSPASDIVLDSGASAPVAITVAPPADAKTGTQERFTIRARSSENPNITDEVTLLVAVRSNREVGLWFDVENGPRNKVLSYNARETRAFPILVKNLGNVEDTYRLRSSVPEEGWTATLLRGPARATRVTLGPGESAALSLSVTAPDAERFRFTSIEVVAESEATATSAAKVVATAKIRSALSVALAVEEPDRFVDPGSTVRWPLTLENRGNEPTPQILVRATATLPPGWGPLRLELSGAPFEEISNLPPRRPLAFELVLPVAPDATALQEVDVRIGAEVLSAEGRAEPSLSDFENVSAIPKLLHNLTLQPVAAPPLPPGRTIVVPLSFENHGNGDERLTLLAVDPPPALSVNTSGDLVVARGETVTHTIQATAAAGAPAGAFPLRLRARFAAGGETNFTLLVDVPVVSRVERVALDQEDLLPGADVRRPIVLANTGNRHENATIALGLPTGWNGTLRPSSYALPPGRSATLELSVAPPRAAVPGRYAADVKTLRDDGTLATIPLTLAVARGELSLSDVLVRRNFSDLSEGDFYTATAIVANPSNATVRNVTVALVVEGARVDETAIDVIPGNETRIATLRWRMEFAPETAEVRVDPDDAVVEADETDNVRSLLAGDRGLPGPPAWFLFLLVAAVAAVRRR